MIYYLFLIIKTTAYALFMVLVFQVEQPIILLISFFFKQSAFQFNIQNLRSSQIIETMHIGMPKLTLSICNLISPIVINHMNLAVGETCVIVALSIKSSIQDYFYVAGWQCRKCKSLIPSFFIAKKTKKWWRPITYSQWLLLRRQ